MWACVCTTVCPQAPGVQGKLLDTMREGPHAFPLLSTHLCCLQLPLSPEALFLSSPLAPLPGQQGSEARVIRVSVNNDHGNLYRSILVRGWAGNPLEAALPLALGCHTSPPTFSSQLTSQDKAPSVVQRALQKHNVAQPWACDYQLFQVLPGDRGEQGHPGGWAGGQLAGGQTGQLQVRWSWQEEGQRQ